MHYPENQSILYSDERHTMKFKAKILVSKKPAVLNPEEKAIADGLKKSGFMTVSNVTTGKYIIVEFKEITLDEAVETCQKMCRRFLINPVTEVFEIESVEMELS